MEVLWQEGYALRCHHVYGEIENRVLYVKKHSASLNHTELLHVRIGPLSRQVYTTTRSYWCDDPRNMTRYGTADGY